MQTASKRQKKGLKKSPKKKFSNAPLIRPSSWTSPPVAVGSIMGPRRNPSVTNTSKGVVIRHRELFLVPTVDGTEFHIFPYAVNPGMTTIFPWLSSIALRYETYRFNFLKFSFQSQMPTISPGSVGLALDFDVSDPDPADVMEFLAQHDSVSGPVWSPNSLVVDLSGAHGQFKFVRAGFPSGTWDQKTYDLGNFYFMAVGTGDAAITPGLVLVEYEIELCTPQIQDPAAGETYSATGLSQNNWMGTDLTPMGHTKLPWHQSGNTIHFDQPWEGLVTCVLVGTGLAGPAVFNEASGLTHKTEFTAATAAQNYAIVHMVLKAAAGAILAMGLTAATTVTSTRWYFGKAGYDQFTT
jgi:hypothetical protein